MWLNGSYLKTLDKSHVLSTCTIITKLEKFLLFNGERVLSQNIHYIDLCY